MPQATAVIPASRGSIWLQQLCKHWSHRFAVEFDATQGTIDFGGGEALTLSATAEQLTLTATVAEGGDLAALQRVVTDHLLRFAFRDPPQVVWAPVTAG